VATYEDYLRDNISWLERLGDKLSGSDERLDYAIQRLAEIQQSLSSLSLDGGITMPKMTEQIVFDQTLLQNQGVRLEDQVPLDGYISSIGFHYPPGVLALVNIAVGHGHRQIMPRSGFLALDDASPVFPAHEAIKRDETIWCTMENTDGVWPHRVSVTVTMIGE